MSKNNSVKREAKRLRGVVEELKPTNVVEYEKNKTKLTALNDRQKDFISALKHESIVIGAGKAGTGKTFISSAVAAEIYRTHKDVNQIIMTRPNVEVGEKLGFLPGEMDEKFEPYMIPFQDGLKFELGSNKVQSDMYKKLVPVPLGYMRGRSYDNTIMLLDEAQNTTIEQMKMFLTRIGTGSRMFITGDVKQTDLRGSKMNGLQWLIHEIKRQNKNITVIDFQKEDCVRSDECMDMLDLIDNAEE